MSASQIVDIDLLGSIISPRFEVRLLCNYDYFVLLGSA